MSNVTAATISSTLYGQKGNTVYVTTPKGRVEGELVSINSKGVNVKVNGKMVSRALGSITDVGLVTPDTEFTPGTDYTAQALATIFGTSARRLRVQLRKLGLGVGQGHMYHLTADQARNVKTALTA